MDFYSTLSRAYNELYQEEQFKKVQLILKNISIGKSDTVLDVGCGTALYAHLFNTYKGIDNNKEMLSLAKGKTLFGYAENLPFQDKSVDVVLCITAFHNFKNPEQAIQEMKRVAKKYIAITLLKKAKKFSSLQNIIKKNLMVKTIDEEKDVIFISRIF